MSALNNEIVNMVNLLPESDKVYVFELVKRLLPDDIATPEDLAAHDAAMEEYRRGKTIRHEDIDWDNLESMNLG